MKINVIKPGAQTQLQDEGRWGHQRFGVPVCGAMDGVSHRVANWLAGNAADEATLEIVLIGPSLRFEAPATIAICGADMSPRIGGEPVPMHRRVQVAAGTQLDFGKRVDGLRSYLALGGGFDVAPVMGSRSTFVRGGFGGWQGRALRKGDVLEGGAGTAPPGLAQGAQGAQDLPPSAQGLPPSAQGLPPSAQGLPLSAQGLPQSTQGLPPNEQGRAFVALPLPAGVELPRTVPSAAPDAVAVVRVITGEHWSSFTPQAQALWQQSSYRLTAQSDRMGYRLEGPVLQRAVAGELVSEGVSFGTVQVPPDGQPIVLMAERQSTGGYPKIAHVASVDLPLLAQLAPMQALRFELVTLEAAQALYLEREQQLARLRQALLALAGDDT